MREKIELLQEELLGLQLAAGHLGYSMERCHNLIGQEELPPEQLERLVPCNPQDFEGLRRALTCQQGAISVTWP